MYKTVFSLSTSLLISCCSSLNLKETSPVTQNNANSIPHVIKSPADLQYLSCDTKSWFVEKNGKSYGAPESHKKEWASSMHALPQRYSEVAAKSVPYAIMANNVYRSPSDKPYFYLPDWKVVNRHESKSGLALEELHKIVNGNLQEIVIAYKGTDGPSLKDWKTNLSIWLEPNQYAEAQKHMKDLLKYPSYYNIPITVTGHSLGGGIALNVSLRQSTTNRPISVFTFNTSPRGFYKPINDSLEGIERYLLDEKGEFLGGARPFWHTKLKKYNLLTYNFLDFTTIYSKPVSEHSIYLFTRALLLVALGRDDEYAKKVFQENFDMDDIQNQIPSASELLKHRDNDLQLCKDLLS